MVELGIVVQHTLKTPIHCTGIGLHTGVKTAMTLRPAPIDTGIVFRQIVAGREPVEIRADWVNTIESSLCSTLSHPSGATIMTVEHVMAALSGCAIDNAIVEITGPEIPIMDGSAAPFVFLIECAGMLPQAAPRRAIRVTKSVRVGDDRQWASLEPDDLFSVECAIDFESRVIARQVADVAVDPTSFKADVSRARTFGFLHDVDRLRAAGRALGGSLDNVVVISGDRVMNEGGLRYTDEFVRHKVLDAIGDLYLAGAPLLGRFRSARPSHALSRRLLQALFADPLAFAVTTLPAVDFQVPSWDLPMQAMTA